MNILYIRNKKYQFEKEATSNDYHSLVQLGQQLAGYGRFYVESGTRVPTREEQLLLPPLPGPTKRNRKQEILESI